MGEILRVEGFTAKIESVYGTDPTPTGSDAIRVTERIWTDTTEDYAFPNLRDEAVNGSRIPLPPGAAQGRMMTVEFGTELVGSRSGGAYASGNRAPQDPLLRACGLSAAVDTTGGAEKITYTHLESGHESCTIYLYAGGELYKLVGCRGTVSWPIEAGILSQLRFRMQGMLIATPATTVVVAPTYATPGPTANVNAALTIGGWSPERVFTAEFAQNNPVTMIPDARGARGIGAFEAADVFQPMYRITAPKPAIATYDPRGDKEAANTNGLPTARTITYQLNSASQYKSTKFTATAYINSIGRSQRFGYACYDLGYFLASDFSIICL